jgi:large subunit ribosomal protein L18e
MARTIEKGNPELVRTLTELRRATRHHDAPIWGTVAERLNRPRHQVDPVNVGHIDRVAKPNEVIVVPGKLLAEGRITKPVTVAAFHYSAEARAKVRAAGGSTLSIEELLKSRPDGAGVRVVA